ncbi:MAG: hypothetical protein AAF862_11140 [Pseudomonadota bacterium]
MELYSILRAIAALTLVLGMIWGGLWLLRRYGGQFLPTPPAKAERQLSILETLNLPPRHKLVRIKNGSQEHLLLLGPENSLELAPEEIRTQQ